MIPQCKSLLVIPSENEGMSLSILYTNGFVDRIKKHYPIGTFQYTVFLTTIPADKVPAFKSDNALMMIPNWVNKSCIYGIEVTDNGFFIFRMDWRSILIPFGILPDLFIKK